MTAVCSAKRANSTRRLRDDMFMFTYRLDRTGMLVHPWPHQRAYHNEPLDLNGKTFVSLCLEV
jgi:hypothetical protein